MVGPVIIKPHVITGHGKIPRLTILVDATLKQAITAENIIVVWFLEDSIAPQSAKFSIEMNCNYLAVVIPTSIYYKSSSQSTYLIINQVYNQIGYFIQIVFPNSIITDVF